MNIEKLGISQKTATIILGAGASRGASCFEGKRVASPLDADFFRTVQAVDLKKRNARVQELLNFVRLEFDPALDIPMEKFFTEVESLASFYATAKIDSGPRVKRYSQILDRFTGTLGLIFDLLAAEVGRPGALRCRYHDELAKMLEHGNANFTPDTILSFNYDCIMDEALKACAKKRWNAAEGYGHRVTHGAEHWHNHQGESGPLAKRSIRLLKLHGSLNWDRHASTADVTKPAPELGLRARAYDPDGRTRFEIVPPVWNKAVGRDSVLTGIWKQARQALRDGRVLIVVGYSVPETDLLSKSLLRVAPAEAPSKLSYLIVINPDRLARKKLVELLRAALGVKSQVLTYDTMKDFLKDMGVFV